MIVEPDRNRPSISSIMNDFSNYSQYQSVSERPSTDRRDRMAEMKNLMKNYAKTPAFAKSAPQAVPQSKDISIFKVGMSVEHSRFGQGKIISIIGENAKIEFPVLGVKTFNMRLAPIKPLD